jgi:sulfur dioxygenase
VIFQQFFDPVSSTFTYLLAKARGTEALIIDPVLENVDDYLKFLGDNSLKLVVALDTHVHADHKTGLGKLRSLTRCMTCLGHNADVENISRRLKDGDKVCIEGLEIEVIETPGHTDDSCSYHIEGMVFTGDTLLIRGNGRTDFQNGDASELYDSIDKKLFALPDETTVWPGHDYKGEHVSTIGREKLENPRYAGKSRDEFINIMNTLNLSDPTHMDVAVPFNKGFSTGLQESLADDQVLNSAQLKTLENHLLVDLREDDEIAQVGTIPNSLSLPLRKMEKAIKDLEHPINHADNVVFFCAHGERSALAIKLSQELGFENAKHLAGGMAAWLEEGGATTR